MALQVNIIFSDLKTHETSLWNLLLFSGYLTPNRLYKLGDRSYEDLKLPNREVTLEFQDMAQRWFEIQLGDSSKVKQLIRALLEGDAELLQEHLSRLLLVLLSYQDVKGNVAEALYHAFFLGLLAVLEPQSVKLLCHSRLSKNFAGTAKTRRFYKLSHGS